MSGVGTARPSLDELRARDYPRGTVSPFFNAASYGLLPRRVVEASNDLVSRRAVAHGFEEREMGAALGRCREAAARLVGCDADEVALVHDTSMGINLATACVASGPPGTVVLSQGEFLANVVPWHALSDRGFRVETVPTTPAGLPDEEALLAALDGPDVRALALSAVQFSSGFLADLERLGGACRQKEVLFFVDAIQALGVVPVDVRRIGAHILATGGQKWLCGPWGSGFAYVERSLVERFPPPVVGWLSVEGALDFQRTWEDGFELLGDARRFEGGTLGIQDFLGLAHAIELFLEVGVDRIREHVFGVQEPLLDWVDRSDGVRLVTPRSEEKRAGIVTFVPPDPDASAARLEEAGVAFALRQGMIRFSPHFYNTVEEMERAVDALRKAG